MEMFKASQVERITCEDLREGDTVVTERSYGYYKGKFEVVGVVARKDAITFRERTGNKPGYRVFHNGFSERFALYTNGMLTRVKA
jgi:hypothetical protein